MKLMMLLMNWRVILMNNKERLKDIEKQINSLQLPRKNGKTKVMEDIKFPIEQAERVEELEKLLSISDEFDGHIKNTDTINARYYREKALALHLDNKKYREALEFYAEEKTYNFDLIHDEHGTLIDSEIMDDAGLRARRALDKQ